MTDDLREALNNASASLAQAPESTRPIIRAWIDQLLDLVNSR